jgi:hypothetical protein
LRAIVAYLFAEVARNFHLVHRPEEWIDCVTWSQRGDRSVDIDPERLAPRATLETSAEWEKGLDGPALLDRWLERCGATRFDYQRDLDDESLAGRPPDIRRLAGASFFRGLALIDLTEAMLKRAFGRDAVAVRVNAAGQGDFFQVHIDAHKASPAEVKQFLRVAFYRRFGLTPETEFVEIHPRRRGNPAQSLRQPRATGAEVARAGNRCGPAHRNRRGRRHTSLGQVIISPPTLLWLRAPASVSKP